MPKGLKKLLSKKGSDTNRELSKGTKTAGSANLLLSKGTKAALGTSLPAPNGDMAGSMTNLLGCWNVGCTGINRGSKGTKAGWIGTKAGWKGIGDGLRKGGGAGRGVSLTGVTWLTGATVAGGDSKFCAPK